MKSNPSDSKPSLPSAPTTTAQSSEPFGDPSFPAYIYNSSPSKPAVPEMLPTRPPVAPKGHEATWRRFTKALFFAVLIYLLLVGLSKSFFHLLEENLVPGQPDGPHDADGRVVRCTRNLWRLEVEQQQEHPAMLPPIFPPYTSKVSFYVPSASSLIFLLSRGSYDKSSSVTFELSDEPGYNIEIKVEMSYFNNAALDRAQVCLLERDEGGRGVGIFTPRAYYPTPRESERIKFAVTLRFPKSLSPAHPLVINALETHVGDWSHHLLHFKDRVVFKYLSLHGSNAQIHGQFVSADIAALKTSNAPITGSYNVSTSLVLKTSNSPITADIRLENHDRYNPTQLDVKTSNGAIKILTTLLSAENYLLNPAAFFVNVKTSNGALDVTFPVAPVSPFSLLDLVAKTSNAAANVKLHETYEGSFSLKTSSYFTAIFVPNPKTEDPSGQDRHRIVTVRKVAKSMIEGSVWWGNDKNKKEKGSVVVTTSNSNNMVELS